jgi:transcriptional regulator with XRE-family HTH domain
MKWFLFSQTISDKRLNEALTYKQCSEQSGVSEAVIWRAMNNHAVDIDAIEKLSLWAGINPLDYLEADRKWKI